MGEMEKDAVRFHHTTQKKNQPNDYELFISANFHLIFSGPISPQVIIITESKTIYKKGIPWFIIVGKKFLDFLSQKIFFVIIH